MLSRAWKLVFVHPSIFCQGEIHIGIRKFLNNNWQNSNTQGESREEDNNNPRSNTMWRDPNKEKYSKEHIVIPYTQRLGESIKKRCNKYGIQTTIMGNRTIKEMLVKPKDKDPMSKRSGDIYWYQCLGAKTQLGVHRGDIQDLWRKIQGTSEGTPTYPCTQHPDRTQHQPNELQHNREGGPWPSQNYQGINIH